MQRKQEVNTVKENLYGSEIGLCTAVRKLATGKWTQLLADKERVMPGLQHWLNRKAKTMEDAVVAALEQFPPELVKTITCDRGSEFANWDSIEKRLHCEVYFADPYCAWQKGTNENSNGLLREFYPKGRNLSGVSPKTLKRNLALINARPRKVLNFHSAQELWDLELAKCCT